nr:MAG TPA: hypothetical protein [Caudoviricetes sp.]
MSSATHSYQFISLVRAGRIAILQFYADCTSAKGTGNALQFEFPDLPAPYEELPYFCLPGSNVRFYPQAGAVWATGTSNVGDHGWVRLVYVAGE